MKSKLQQLAVAAFALCLGGCVGTSIKQSWKSPAYQGGPVKKVRFWRRMIADRCA